MVVHSVNGSESSGAAHRVVLDKELLNGSYC